VSKVFSWIMLVISAAMLFLQFGVAAQPKIPVAAFWIVVAIACVYVLFFKKVKPESPE
jgi:hypothetical protein